MFGHRTPPKRRMSEKKEKSEERVSVRRLTGEFEAANKTLKSPQQPSTSTSTLTSNKINKTRLEKASLLKKRVMTQLSLTRNTKTEIKNEIQTCVQGLYDLIKEAEEKTRVTNSQSQINKEEKKIEKEIDEKNTNANMDQLLHMTELLKENTKILKEIKQKQEKQEENYKQNRETSIIIEQNKIEINKTLEENNKIIKENSNKLDNLNKNIIEYKEEVSKRSYASVVAEPKSETPSPPQRTALHSIVITSKDPIHTSQEVLEMIKETIKAKEEGVAVECVRKAKDQKVIIGCKTEKDREKIKTKLKKAQDRITVEDAINKKPLIVLKHVINQNTDDDIKIAIKTQNRHIFEGLSEQESSTEILFRKKTKNHQVSHVVARVASVLWKRMTEQGYMYIDLQKVKVEDHSPLIQCTMCLGYGHSRKLCSEKVPKCCHCGGSHVKNKCGEWLANTTPSCSNCSHAKLDDKAHNAFSNVCPIRKKWDSLARATIAYN